MKKELEQKLVEEFPLLYADINESMTSTCMCWGFECCDGWFDLIYDLSSKLEPLILDIKSKSPKQCVCGELAAFHAHYTGSCFIVYRVPYNVSTKLLDRVFDRSIPCKVLYSRRLTDRIRAFKWNIGKRIRHYLAAASWYLFDVGILRKSVPSSCFKFRQDYPRASQVKEKYGTLSFYMTKYTPEIEHLIKAAEKKSASTCELCGATGRLRTGSWLSTLCDKCAKCRSK